MSQGPAVSSLDKEALQIISGSFPALRRESPIEILFIAIPAELLASAFPLASDMAQERQIKVGNKEKREAFRSPLCQVCLNHSKLSLERSLVELRMQAATMTTN